MVFTAMTDDRGNVIECEEGREFPGNITFTGSNNRLVIKSGAHFSNLVVMFNASNGYCEIGANPLKRGFSASIRVGIDSRVVIGEGVSATAVVGMSAVEATSIEIGNDVMFASQVQLRADDGHAIFDVKTGNRINVAKDIKIGSHVWLAWGAWVLGGGEIGDGSVIGANSLVNTRIPNNVVAVGTPARVIRKDIAWERPHVGMTEPYMFGHIDDMPAKSDAYWNFTKDTAELGESMPKIKGKAGKSDVSSTRKFLRSKLSEETRSKVLKVFPFLRKSK